MKELGKKKRLNFCNSHTVDSSMNAETINGKMNKR
jgi:hypothetical protein